MPTRKLTDLFVKRIQGKPGKRLDFFDASFGGLALRVTESNHKSWSLMYRIYGRQRRLTLGSFPPITPAVARQKATEALDKVAQGKDPASEKKAIRNDPLPETDTFENLWDDYLKLYAANEMRDSTRHKVMLAIKKDVLPLWKAMPLEEITKKHVIHMLNQIGKRPRAANSKSGGAVQMNRTFSMVRAIFNWAVSQARLESSPLDGMKKPRSEDERERVLSDDEIRWFWGACDDVGYPFGHVGKLLLSTLQRRSEVSDLPWPELDLRNTTWNIPGPRTKNKNAHIVHLSTGALRILKNTPLPHTGFVFTTLGDRPVSGFAKAKELLDQAMLIRRRRELGLPEDDAGMRKLLKIAADKPLPIEIPEWTYHDLRRTGTTKMAGKPLKVPPHVVDKILNHSKGTIRGVAKIYNREEYLEERAEALDAWSAWLDAHMRVQKAKPSKVVRLRG